MNLINVFKVHNTWLFEVIELFSKFNASVKKNFKVTPSHLLEVRSYYTTIADVAVRKRHQRLAETLIIFTRTIQESGKLFHEQIYLQRMHL